jgi:hypothetical protein
MRVNADNQSNDNDAPKQFSKEVVLETGPCLSIPGDEDADTMHAVQSSIPGGIGGDAVEGGDVDIE